MITQTYRSSNPLKCRSCCHVSGMESMPNINIPFRSMEQMDSHTNCKNSLKPLSRDRNQSSSDTADTKISVARHFHFCHQQDLTSCPQVLQQQAHAAVKYGCTCVWQRIWGICMHWPLSSAQALPLVLCTTGNGDPLISEFWYLEGQQSHPEDCPYQTNHYNELAEVLQKKQKVTSVCFLLQLQQVRISFSLEFTSVSDADIHVCTWAAQSVEYTSVQHA